MIPRFHAGSFTIAALFILTACVAVRAYEPESPAWGRNRRALLIDTEYCYSINLRLEPPGVHRFYITRHERDNANAAPSYSDLMVTLPEEHEHLSSVGVLGNRFFAVVIPPSIEAPYGDYAFSLVEYPLFDPARKYTSLVDNGQMNIRGEIVHRSPEEKERGAQIIRDTIRTKGFDGPEKFDGKHRRLFVDVSVYNYASNYQGPQTRTKAVTFVPFDADSGAVAILGKNGQVFFFRYQIQGKGFNPKKDDIEIVGKVDGPVKDIYLTADERIIVQAGEGLTQFRRTGGAWQKEILRERFPVVGRIWDRRSDEDILLSSENDATLKIGSLTVGNAITPSSVETQRIQELRGLWNRTMPSPATKPAPR